MNKKCRWWVCRPYARWWNDHRRVLLYRGEGSNPTLRWCMGTTVQNCQFKHVETRFVWCIMVPHPEPSVRTWWDFFFSPRSLLAAGKFLRAGLFYWAASRHRLCLYWPVSRCAVGREGVSPDLPLPGWGSTGRHSWAGVGEELAEGWKISVKVVVGGKIFKQKTGSEGRGCCVGKESRPAGHQSRCRWLRGELGGWI